MFRRTATWLCVAATLLVCVPGIRAEQQPKRLDEQTVKAGFLLNFALFVTWPESTSRTAPFVIGILGDQPFTRTLQALAAGKNVRGRAVVVRELVVDESPDGCDMVIVGQQFARQVPAVLRKTRAAVLTVGETPSFIEDGGMIALVTRADRVRFKVNTAAAQHAGLRLASQLLSLAE